MLRSMIVCSLVALGCLMPTTSAQAQTYVVRSYVRPVIVPAYRPVTVVRPVVMPYVVSSPVVVTSSYIAPMTYVSPVVTVPVEPVIVSPAYVPVVRPIIPLRPYRRVIILP
jgi:hypothetical protein